MRVQKVPCNAVLLRKLRACCSENLHSIGQQHTFPTSFRSSFHFLSVCHSFNHTVAYRSANIGGPAAFRRSIPRAVSHASAIWSIGGDFVLNTGAIFLFEPNKKASVKSIVGFALRQLVLGDVLGRPLGHIPHLAGLRGRVGEVDHESARQHREAEPHSL
eukprot:CAMPEP_0171880912 /NCGR_PEP_ID=MMETSP0992-20121227/38708_1 /TAXON_ID=483369 /ORGANISM="non described non described, Strain CCMP2098" /LENGTH=159 /DNA_ID=CAMNT_0012506711 /DNA_START=73 /DNA_END=552 /DNA_ORIENTATION=+